MKFHLDSPLVDYINTFVCFVFLNIVFLLCCIPVITIGPALAALYHITLREANKEYGYMFRTYFKHFLKYFWPATGMFLGLAISFLIALFSIFFWNSMGTVFSATAVAVLVIFAAGIFAVFTYAFPLYARYRNTIRQTIRNAFGIAINHPMYTLVLLLTDIIFGSILYLSDAGKIFMGVVGFSFETMCKSLIIAKVFEKYEFKEEI